MPRRVVVVGRPHHHGMGVAGAALTTAAVVGTAAAVSNSQQKKKEEAHHHHDSTTKVVVVGAPPPVVVGAPAPVVVAAPPQPPPEEVIRIGQLKSHDKGYYFTADAGGHFKGEKEKKGQYSTWRVKTIGGEKTHKVLIRHQGTKKFLKVDHSGNISLSEKRDDHCVYKIDHHEHETVSFKAKTDVYLCIGPIIGKVKTSKKISDSCKFKFHVDETIRKQSSKVTVTGHAGNTVVATKETPSVAGAPPPAYPPAHDPNAAAYPPGAYPPGAYPPQQYPPGAYPPQQYPPGAYPPGAYPPQQYPPGAYPPQQYPPGAYPPQQYPPGAYPPGAYPPQ